MITLRLDHNGVPYLELQASDNSLVTSLGDDTLHNQALKLFVRLAQEKGVGIHNEADMDTRDDYASIRIVGAEQD